jgi:amidase
MDAFSSATELRRLIAARSLSPVEVVDFVLGRIDHINPDVNAYCTVAAEQAVDAARKAEAALMRGNVIAPLHGIPVAVKDMAPTAGIRTTFGSRLFADYVPDVDALQVTRLRQAGAIIIGKTNTPEFAAGANTTNALFGSTRNPWALDRSPGGSSGGSAAALAAGLGPLATGGDLGGSLRIPASLCGVVGFRPSPGRVPSWPSAWTSEPFVVLGPMARTVTDTALLLSVMAGPDDRVPISLETPGRQFERAAEGGVDGLRVAWSADLGGGPVEPAVRAVVEAACLRLTEAGCQVDADGPDVGDVRSMITAFRALGMAVRSDLVARAGEVDNLLLREFLQRAGALEAADVTQALTDHSRYVERMAAFFRRYDLLVTPTTRTAAWPIDQMYPSEVAGHPVRTTIDAMMLTYAVTMAQLPAISVPAGFTPEGLPVGMQIVGGRHADALVLRAAAAFEQVAPWTGFTPPLASQ